MSQAVPRREGQTFGGASILVRYVNFVKLPHTLFALPFALLGVLAASLVVPLTLRTVLLVVIAFSRRAGWRWASTGSPTARSTPGTRGPGTASCRAAR